MPFYKMPYKEIKGRLHKRHLNLSYVHATGLKTLLSLSVVSFR